MLLPSFHCSRLLPALLLLLPLGVAAQSVLAPDLFPAAPAPTLLAGNLYELTTTDGQSRPTGRMVLQTVALRCAGATTHVTLRHTFFDAANQLVTTTELPAIFAGARLAQLDVRALINGPLLAALHVKELEVQADSLAALPHPTDRPDQGLAPAHLTLVSTAGAPLRSVTLTLLGRYLTGSESLTTPAGTFACQRLTQLLEIERFDNGVQQRHTLRLICWVAPGTGLVRAETYVGNQLFDTTSLTRIRPAAPVEAATAVAVEQ